jgi:hypothetical protein
MPNRSQRHLVERQGYDSSGWGPGTGPPSPPITGILPNAATVAAAGAVGRTLVTLLAAGGTGPFTWSVINNAGLALGIQISTNLIVSTQDPIGVAGPYTIRVRALDSVGVRLDEDIALTVT